MQKKELRKIFKLKRKDLSDEERELLSQMILDNLIDGYDISGLNVSIFLPIEKLQEINTWNILDSIDAKFIVPVVQKDGLKHIVLESKDQLQVSDWGIPEPSYGEEFEPEDLDIVLVPLLACDIKGNRVGYGAGFYDGFLKLCKPDCNFIGLSYFEPIDIIEDVYESDVALHYCITPNSIHHFKK